MPNFKKGWSHSKDTKQKMRDWQKRKIAQHSLEDELLNIYDSAKEASKITNTNRSSITMVCRGTRKQAGGFKWKYLTSSNKYS